MRGGLTGSIDIIVRALLQEFPGLDPTRLRAAVERGTAKADTASLDTEGHRIVSQQLARVEATEESAERAAILRSLAADLESRGDAERALVVRLSAFAEQQDVADLDPLLRLGRVTERWGELPLDALTVLVEIDDPASAGRLREIAAAWRELGSAYRAADAYERVLLLAPDDEIAHDGLETFYRSTGEWPVLVDLLRRRAELPTINQADRAELHREIAQIHERELGDDAGAREAYREADRLVPDHPEVLDALARIAVKLGGLDDEALTALERTSSITSEPKARAQVLHRAAEIARQTDWDKSLELFERAHREDPELVAVIDGLALLLRDRGELENCVDILVAAVARPALVAEHSRWAADAADFCVALGDTERAKELYRTARTADPTNHHAGLALVELCWDTGAVVELAPILEELCRTTTEPARLRGYLIQLAKVSRELGDHAAVRAALTRAVAIDPDDPGPCRELADILFEAGDWAGTRPLLELLLDEHEATFDEDTRVELHFRAARCAKELGDDATAAKQTAMALALAPNFRPALLLRSELGDADPFARAADQLALANSSPPEERAARFAALGDTYAKLEDPATAREMYREALLYQPNDRMLLTKSLGLVADEGDWSYSLDLVSRLAESETDPVVRGRYRYLAGTIARDNLDDPERALPLFDRAIEDDPKLFVAADSLEEGLASDREALVGFYYRRLGHVRDDEGRAGERLRLWTCLGDLCNQLGRLDDTIVAVEVQLSLDPENHKLRERLAGLYDRADPKHDPAAIAHHHTLLALDKRRIASYVALRAAHKRLGQIEQARACDEALSIIGAGAASAARIEELFADDAVATPHDESTARRPLANEDWIALARLDVDPQLSALFAIVAPSFAAERARTKPPRALAGKDVRDRELPIAVGRVLGQVLAAFGLARPPVYVDRDQLVAATIALRARDGVLAPVLVLGKPALDTQYGDRELAFLLARQLADLRSDRIARLLCPRPGDLAQLVELVITPAGQGPARTWLSSTLHAVELDKALAIGERLRDQNVDPMRAARQWRAATERAADRIGLVVAGDLATCVRLLEGQGTNVTSDVHRVLDLVWASVTEDVLAVRARVEGWRRR